MLDAKKSENVLKLKIATLPIESHHAPTHYGKVRESLKKAIKSPGAGESDRLHSPAPAARKKIGSPAGENFHMRSRSEKAPEREKAFAFIRPFRRHARRDLVGRGRRAVLKRFNQLYGNLILER